MRIAHLARACYPFHPYGGLEQHVYHLTLELARLGHQVNLYTQPPDLTLGGLPERVEEAAWQDRVTHHYVPYRTVGWLRRNSIPDRLVNYPLFSGRLAGAVHRATGKIEIVHAHGLAGLGYARRPLPGVPLVLNPHGMEEFKGRSRAKWLAYAPFRAQLRQTARRAAAVIATDTALLPEVERFLGAGSATVLIANAVALDEIDQLSAGLNLKEVAGRLGMGEGRRFRLLSVGRLEANKGYGVMLRGLAAARPALDRQRPDWGWWVVGQGSQAGFLKQEAARLGLTDRVFWPGQVDPATLHALYELADLFVHPTLYEGSSLATLEALAHRMPVLATATGGLPDKVFGSGPFENGRIVPPGDVAALASGLLELAALSDERLKTLGETGRKLVEARFSWKAAAAQTVELYTRLLEGNDLPRPPAP